MKSYVPYIFATFLATNILFISCKKENNTEKKSADNELADAVTLAQSTFGDVTAMIDQAAIYYSVNLRTSNGASQYSQMGSLTSPCVHLTRDTVDGVATRYTIDFGSHNCLCVDGRNRRGKVIASFTGGYNEGGQTIGIHFEDYFVNDHEILGEQWITNHNNNMQGRMYYAVQDVDCKIISPNLTDTIRWTSWLERDWTEGGFTLQWSDDVYSTTGGASGKTPDGTAFNISITKPLVRRMNCQWFESGTISVTPEGKAVRTIDFGDSGCDSKAVITVEAVNIPVVLP